MTFSVWIDAKEEVKLVFLNFDYAVKVARLEYTIKDELFLQLQWRVHTLKRPIE